MTVVHDGHEPTFLRLLEDELRRLSRETGGNTGPLQEVRVGEEPVGEPGRIHARALLARLANRLPRGSETSLPGVGETPLGTHGQRRLGPIASGPVLHFLP